MENQGRVGSPSGPKIQARSAAWREEGLSQGHEGGKESGWRRAESSGILEKFRGRCDMATPSVRKPFRLPLREYLQPNEGERTATARSPQIGRSGGPADGNHRRALPPNFYFSVFPLTPHGSNRRGGSGGSQSAVATRFRLSDFRFPPSGFAATSTPRRRGAAGGRWHRFRARARG